MVCVFELPGPDGCTLQARLDNPHEHPVWFVLPPLPSALTQGGAPLRELALPDGRTAVQLDPGERATVGSWPRLTSAEEFRVVVAESDIIIELPAGSPSVLAMTLRLNEFTGFDNRGLRLAHDGDAMHHHIITIAREQIWRSAACW